ncbi:MAG TPA: quinone oxidoreductase, partial [Gemmatimonadaceae bacterium]|nr:quinone oxidoreductase [Gemmatimonadaceae bacterium]
AKGIRFYETGAPEVLRWESLPVGDPGTGEVRVRHVAVGLNFADTYFRTGLYPAPLPAGMGVEAAGVIEAVGPGVTDFAEGDRVTYTGSPLGAYSTERVMDVGPLIKLPDTIPFETAAAMTMRGLTTSYLLRRIADLNAGDTVLLHAAAGGVGLLLCQIASRQRGARVIGTVSTEEKAALAREAGASDVILYTRQDFVAEVKRLTGGAGVQVVYDSVGRTTFDKSLDCLARRGLLALFGQSSGPVPPLDPQLLNQKGSLYLTRPNLAHYAVPPAELRERAGELLAWIARGELSLRIDAELPLAEAVEAHRRLESRETTGKLLLIP